MSFSLNNKLQKIQLYIKKKGWTQEYVILHNIICDLEKNDKEKGSDLIALIENYDSAKGRCFFDQFKKFVTNKKGEVDLLKLHNTWEAFDSATASLQTTTLKIEDMEDNKKIEVELTNIL